MKNGFYHLQDEYAGNIPAFLDALDGIESDITVQLKSGESRLAPVSVASFMLGFCGELAMYFHRKYGFEIGILQDEDELLHVFNVFSPSPSKRYFLDARGITDDLSLFLEPFSLCPSNLLYAKDIESAQALAPAGEWYFPEDEISDAMITWLLNTYPKHYDPSPLLTTVHQAESKETMTEFDRIKAMDVVELATYFCRLQNKAIEDYKNGLSPNGIFDNIRTLKSEATKPDLDSQMAAARAQILPHYEAESSDAKNSLRATNPIDK